MGRLTAAFVESARPGFWADGDNLYLDVRGANSKNWQLVYQRQGRERSKGLGSAKFVTLAEAREKAFEARRLLRQGIDPIEAGAANAARTRIAALNTITFEDAARQSIAARSAQWRTAKWGAEWLSTLERYAFPIIGALPVPWPWPRLPLPRRGADCAGYDLTHESDRPRRHRVDWSLAVADRSADCSKTR